MLLQPDGRGRGEVRRKEGTCIHSKAKQDEQGEGKGGGGLYETLSEHGCGGLVHPLPVRRLSSEHYLYCRSILYSVYCQRGIAIFLQKLYTQTMI